MTTPIQTRDDGGVHIYYALPIENGYTGVFEHVSSWPNRTDAGAEITRLEAADRQRTHLALNAREAIACGRPCDVTNALEELLAALQESGLL